MEWTDFASKLRGKSIRNRTTNQEAHKHELWWFDNDEAMKLALGISDKYYIMDKPDWSNGIYIGFIDDYDE